MLNDPINDIKWIQENGFEVIKKRVSPNAKLDSFGDFLTDEHWITSTIYVVYKQTVDKDNQTEFGEVNFQGYDTIQLITIPFYDVRINDLIIIPSEYDIYSESETDQVYKTKKILANSFMYNIPRSQTITLERRYPSEYLLEQ